MSNLYFTYTSLTPNSVARATDVNTRFQAVETAFDLLPDPTKLAQDRHVYYTAGGTANALTVTPSPAIASYVEGLHLRVKIATTNTGAATVNVSALGAKGLKRADGTALIAGDLIGGTIHDLVYDGTNFRISRISATEIANYVDDAAASASAAAISATAAAVSAAAAATSATSAATSATSASSSATTATTQASAASTSATNAATSATNAASSASAASTSATAAAASATSASGSATTATTQATNAASSASAASTSATNASNSASAASTSATNAATSATNASNSASAAATSASNAATSESNAAASVASISPSTIVRTTGNQTIAGTKTFSDDAVFSGAASVGTTLGVTGAASVGGTLGATGQINGAGGARFTGNKVLRVEATGAGAATSSTGPGIDLLADVGAAYAVGYDYTANAYHPLRLAGQNVSLRPNGVEKLKADTSGVTLGGATTILTMGTTASAANVNHASDGDVLLRSTSSRRYKTDIQDVEAQYADAILNLRPVWYRSLAGADNPTWGWWGFIAEEVAEIDPRLVHWGYQDDQYEEVEIEPAVPFVEEVLDEDGEVITPGQLARPALIERRVKQGEQKRPDGVQYERVCVLQHTLIQRMSRQLSDLMARVEAIEDTL